MDLQHEWVRGGSPRWGKSLRPGCDKRPGLSRHPKTATCASQTWRPQQRFLDLMGNLGLFNGDGQPDLARYVHFQCFRFSSLPSDSDPPQIPGHPGPSFQLLLCDGLNTGTTGDWHHGLFRRLGTVICSIAPFAREESTRTSLLSCDGQIVPVLSWLSNHSAWHKN